MGTQAAENPRKHLIDLMKGFDTAMLSTQPSAGLHTRPMAVVEVADDGTTLFVTGASSPKVHEIQGEAKVLVTMQSKLEFVSVDGFARVVDDRERIAKLWKEPWRVWFPEGPTDPSIRLIEVSPVKGEYWDSSGAEGLKYAFEAVKAYVKGETPDTSREQHDKVRLS